jgi:hypothetical protein
MLSRLVGGQGMPGDVETLESVCNRIMGNCLCPLGEAMAMPVLSYLDKFRSDFTRYITGYTHPDDPALNPLASVIDHVVQHNIVGKPGTTWVGTLTRTPGAVAH